MSIRLVDSCCVNPKYLRSLPPLFARPVLADFARTGRSGAFSNLAAAAGLDTQATVGQIYTRVYQCLIEQHRCEYVFKNQIARRLLLDRHPWREARLLTEFRIGPAKADVVVLNGTSTVYEIKTRLDNLDRLPQQLAAYKKAFDRIYVVCEAEQEERIGAAVDPRVGLIAMGVDGELTETRAAAENAPFTDPVTMLAALRRSEYLEVVATECGAVPDVPNGRLWGECVQLMQTMDPERVHGHMVRLLRARGAAASLRQRVNAAPPALTHALLTLDASDAELEQLARALEAPPS
ncbi:sce7726 family protein [Longimicrobium terrae]|uniref:Sce7726 family protein n=1 Tax=Longimicrobium terrae TaxID=1639882 RepID=A0A841H1V2_9BACT|nr:hypothetical protein [Longimicrobium terrae]MBB6071916.1 hypothetical protein [Longimicrobium terrae]NNC30463.1 sce7726 family protein [Longimicrobium terrae]